MRLMVAPARGPARLLTAGFGLVTSALNEGARRAVAHRRAGVHRRARHALRRLPPARRGHLLDCCRRTGRRSSWSPRRSPTRCARRPTSSSGSPASSMPLAGLVVNRVHLDDGREHQRRRRRVGARRKLASGDANRAGDGRAAGSCTPSGPGCRSARHGSPQRFTAAHPRVPTVSVPALPGDVHDLDGLREIGDLLAEAVDSATAGGLKDAAPGRARSDDGAAAHGARARSCRPRRPTRCGCRAPRRGTRRARSTRRRPAWRDSAQRP